MVYSWKVGGSSRMIYLDGTKAFAQLTAEYVEPVKVRASTDFDYGQIDDAFTKGYINQQEYNDTIVLKTAIVPRNGTNLVASPTV